MGDAKPPRPGRAARLWLLWPPIISAVVVISIVDAHGWQYSPWSAFASFVGTVVLLWLLLVTLGLVARRPMVWMLWPAIISAAVVLRIVDVHRWQYSPWRAFELFVGIAVPLWLLVMALVLMARARRRRRLRRDQARLAGLRELAREHGWDFDVTGAGTYLAGGVSAHATGPLIGTLNGTYKGLRIKVTVRQNSIAYSIGHSAGNLPEALLTVGDDGLVSYDKNPALCGQLYTKRVKAALRGGGFGMLKVQGAGLITVAFGRPFHDLGIASPASASTAGITGGLAALAAVRDALPPDVLAAYGASSWLKASA